MPESLFLTINLIDRYLAARQVTRKNLQLVRTLSHVFHVQGVECFCCRPFILLYGQAV